VYKLYLIFFISDTPLGLGWWKPRQ